MPSFLGFMVVWARILVGHGLYTLFVLELCQHSADNKFDIIMNGQ